MAKRTRSARKKMTKSPYRTKRDLRRLEITEAALKLFAKKSYHDVTMDEVAKKVGVSKGTIYLYFDSKENLYLGILENAFDALVALIESEIAKRDPAPVKLARVLKLVFQYYSENKDVLRILTRDETHLIREHSKLTEDWRLRGVELYEKIIEKGIKEGSFKTPNPKLTGLIIYALVRSVTFHYESEKSPEEVADEVCSVIVNGVLNTEKKKNIAV